MRKAVAVLALLVLSGGGPSFGGGWPFRSSGQSYPVSQPSCPSCAGGGVYGESPLYPELAPWTFEHSECKQAHCTGLRSWLGHGRSCEVPYFPPLPYGHGPYVPNGQPSAFGAP